MCTEFCVRKEALGFNRDLSSNKEFLLHAHTEGLYKLGKSGIDSTQCSIQSHNIYSESDMNFNPTEFDVLSLSLNVLVRKFDIKCFASQS